MRTLLDDRLGAADRVLFAGCGGGFDVYSAVPLALHARSLGKRIAFANLSFTRLHLMGAERVGPTGHVVTANMPKLDYFPELHLKRWLATRDIEAPIYGLEVTGVRPLRDSYAAILARETPDLVVLCDGGTDSLIKGDEEDLGTVVEDATSMVALGTIPGPSKVLACLGFGVDHFHGISHYRFLENAAEATRRGGFLGCASVVAGTPEADAFLDLAAYVDAEQPERRSIVVNSVAGAIRGEFGDHHATARTQGSELFINPLMSMYWAFDLHVATSMMGFAEALRDTLTIEDALDVVTRHHDRKLKRRSRPIPL